MSTYKCTVTLTTRIQLAESTRQRCIDYGRYQCYPNGGVLSYNMCSDSKLIDKYNSGRICYEKRQCTQCSWRCRRSGGGVMA